MRTIVSYILSIIVLYMTVQSEPTETMNPNPADATPADAIVRDTSLTPKIDTTIKNMAIR